MILISIDDTEVANLQILMDSIFGEENRLAYIEWQKRYVSNVTAKWLSDMHDHILCYARNLESVEVNRLPRSAEQEADYRNPDNDPRGPWRAQDLSASKPYLAGQFQIKGPTGEVFSPPPGRYWRCNRATYDAWLDDGRIWFGVNRTARPMLKAFLTESQNGLTPNTWWSHDFAGHNKEATLEIKALFDGESPFDTPKPVKLVRRVLEIFGGRDDTVLDFFAGSGTAAHAVMKLNAEDGGNRRFILVQLPEPLDEPKRLDDGTELRTIADICRERVRRAGRQITSTSNGALRLDGRTPQDVGFRAHRLDTSCFTPWDGLSDGVDDDSRQPLLFPDATGLARQMLLHADNILPDRTDEDVLTELLLKRGFDLAEPVARRDLAGHAVFDIREGAMLVCLDRRLTIDLFEAVAAEDPAQLICLDAGFANQDQLKVNAWETIQAANRERGTSIEFLVV